ncbi:MAG: hypothetical protein ABIQ12_12800 [Opitutaceae bacterium]
MNPPSTARTTIDLFAWRERAPLPLPRAGCATGVVAGRILVAGGTYWRDGKKFWSERTDAFDPLTNRWYSVAPLPQPRGDAAALAHAGALYVFGGGADGAAESSAWIFQHDSWHALLAMKLPAPRRSAAIVAFGGAMYLLGGLSGTGTDFASATPTLWAAKPGHAWEARAPMPGPVRFGAAVGALAGRIVVVGGCTPEKGSVRNLDEIFAYDPAADAWSALGRLPVPVRGACGLVAEGRFLLIGGYTDKFETTIFSLDPQSGAASVAGRLPTGLADTRFQQLGAHVIGVSGENGIKMRFAGTIESGATAS